MDGEKSAARTFGVSDYDSYWVDRKTAGTDRVTRLQRFLAETAAGVVPAGGKVLDCGVGPGNVYRLLLAKGIEMYGVEISDEAFGLYDFDTSRISRRNLNDGLEDVGVRVDCVIAAHIVHHLDSPEGFLAEVERVLAPGGALVVAIPNITYYRYRIGFLFGKFPPVSLAHKNFQTPLEFERMVSACGYEIEKRATAKRTIRARLFPRFFSQDIVYVLKPASKAAKEAS